ncbi:MAG: DUF2975 domain-containing protein [Firmicutes bacterium]|nr:DUF2975 domain-containing protein [Bacillota bacterium]
MKFHKKGFDRAIVKKLSGIAAPVLALMFYFFLGLAVLLTVIGLIVIIVNVPVNEMILPPFIRSIIGNDEITAYSVSLGNGIKIICPAEFFTLGKLKIAIYTTIAVCVGVCLMLAPVCRFVSRLLKNVAADDLLNINNGAYVKFIGLTVMIGQTFILFLSRLFNYYLVKMFVSDGSNVELSWGIDLRGIFAGLIILFVGEIYSAACRFAQSANVTVGKEDNV